MLRRRSIRDRKSHEEFWCHQLLPVNHATKSPDAGVEPNACSSDLPPLRRDGDCKFAFVCPCTCRYPPDSCTLLTRVTVAIILCGANLLLGPHAFVTGLLSLGMALRLLLLSGRWMCQTDAPLHEGLGSGSPEVVLDGNLLLIASFWQDSTASRRIDCNHDATLDQPADPSVFTTRLTMPALGNQNTVEIELPPDMSQGANTTAVADTSYRLTTSIVAVGR